MSSSKIHMTNIKSQNGAGLIAFFMAVILAGTVFLLANTGPDTGRLDNENATSSSLAKAKEALLSYAASYYLRQSTGAPPIPHAGYHGLLPCPEESHSPNDGQEAGNCASQHANSLGRLPWQTLNIPPLKDASGECLWYAVSGNFLNSPQPAMTNDDTPGMFEVFHDNGTIYKGTTAENRVVAVVIAPGGPVANQTRTNATSGLPCKVAYDVVIESDYLDTYQGINNAVVDETNPDLIEQFINSTGFADNTQFNDRIITITADEIFNAIKRNDSLYADKIGDPGVAVPGSDPIADIQELGAALGVCLIEYAAEGFVSGNNNTQTCTTITTCNRECDDSRDLCLLTAAPGLETAACNQIRRDCRRVCRDECITNAGNPGNSGNNPGNSGNNPGNSGNNPGNSGNNPGNSGGAGNNFRLPWPAPINLATDYRLDANYTDTTNVGADGYLGRLPFDISNSSATIGIADPDIFTSCDLSNTNLEMFTLWQNWKDHWFYVVGSDYAPDSAVATVSPCINCPQVDGGNRHAAILIFSDERINGQLRRTNETENPDPALADSKGTLQNYLEGSNLANQGDNNGSGNYGINNQNDRLFCINDAVDTVTECTP